MINEKELEIPSQAIELKKQLTEQQSEAHVLLISILNTLDDSSIIKISKDKNKFQGSNDWAWQVFITDFITATPILLAQETYQKYLQRHETLFSRLNQLLQKDAPKGQTLFELLYEVIEEQVEKLFILLLTRYMGTEVQVGKEKKPFHFNEYKHPERFGRTLVHAAARKNIRIIMQALIKYDANLESKTSDKIDDIDLEDVGFTPLADAAMCDSSESLQLIVKTFFKQKDMKMHDLIKNQIQSIADNREEIEREAAKEANPEKRKTVQGYILETIKYITKSISEEKIAYINASSAGTQASALHHAAQKGNLINIKFLIDHGADLCQETAESELPLQIAFRGEHVDCVVFLVGEMRNKKIIIPGGYETYLPKILKIKKKSQEQLEETGMELESIVAPVTPPQHKLPNTVLENLIFFLDRSSLSKIVQTNHFFYTLAKNHPKWKEIVKEFTENPQLLPSESYYQYLLRHRQILLIYRDFRKSAKPEDTVDLLFSATKINWEKLFISVLKMVQNPKTLINNYSSNEVRSRYLIHCVLEGDNVEMLEAIIEHANLESRASGFIITGESGNWVAGRGNTPLMEAVEKGAHKCLRILLNNKVRKVKIDAITYDRDGEGALHIAAKKGDLESLKLLVTAGANLELKDDDGLIPYKVAKNRDYQDCVSYLAKQMQEKDIAIPEGTSCTLQ